MRSLHRSSHFFLFSLFLLSAGGIVVATGCPGEPSTGVTENDGNSSTDAGDEDTSDGGGDIVEYCDPMSEDELCDERGDECGTVDGVDNGCGEERSINCGDCTAQENSECLESVDPNICVCDAQTCDDIEDPECGSYADGCGGMIYCEGTCPNEDECLEQSDSTYECVSEGECDPQAETCEDFGEDYECGKIADGCDDTVDCGECDGEQVCTDEYQCCMPDSDQKFCQDHGVECGQLTAEDNCGQERTVQCEFCAVGVCSNGNCVL